MAQIDPQSKYETIKSKIHLPDKESHKGQNGRLLVIGGSKIFHAASLWSAEVASRFVDLVHYCSTEENETILTNLKSKFTNGIVIPRDKLLDYVEEDDCILIGPGMERGDISDADKNRIPDFEDIIRIEDEAVYTYQLIRYLVDNYPHKKYVFDAAALQMIEPDMLKKLNQRPILTPHTREFEKLFGFSVNDMTHEETKKIVRETAQEYSCIIMLKNIVDYISDGTEIHTVSGGNEGLSKGGTGDALAGLAAAFNTTSDQLASATIASLIVKSTAEELYEQNASFYNTSDLIASIPSIAKKVLY